MSDNKDITEFWKIFDNSKYNIIIPGKSDDKNMSPPDWHWGAINNVSKKVGVAIPQLSSTIILYKSSIKEDISIMSDIINKMNIYDIKMIFRDGPPDEIIYAVYMGLKYIYPNNYLFNWIINTTNCLCCDKSI